MLNLRRLRRKWKKVLIEFGVGVNPRLSEDWREDEKGFVEGNNIERNKKSLNFRCFALQRCCSEIRCCGGEVESGNENGEEIHPFFSLSHPPLSLTLGLLKSTHLE